MGKSASASMAESERRLHSRDKPLSVNRPLTPSLSPSEGERVLEGRVRGRFKVLMRVQNWGSKVSVSSWRSITITMDGWTSGRLEKKSGCGAISVLPDFRNKQPN